MGKKFTGLFKGKLIYFLIFAILGLMGIVISDELALSPDILEKFRDVSVTISIVGSIGLISELFLRKSFLDEIGLVIDEKLSDRKEEFAKVLEVMLEDFFSKRKVEMSDELRNVIDQTISEKVLVGSQRIYNLGVIDGYEKLDFEKVSNQIDRLRDTEIRILKIFMPEPERFRNSLVNAVKYRNCTVRILLLHPDEEPTIIARTSGIPFENCESYIGKIRNSIKEIKTMKQKLKEDNRDKKIELRLHKGFVSLSLIGIDKEYLVGYYLRNRQATEGTQFKVGKFTRPFFNELSEHFEGEWKSAEIVNFDDEKSLNKLLSSKKFLKPSPKNLGIRS